jgi:colanic acid/amylovoran biosynthesis protein
MSKVKLLLTDNVILNGGDSAILKGTIKGLIKNTSITLNDLTIHCDYFESAVKHYPNLPLKRSLQEAIRHFPPKFFWRFNPVTRFSQFKQVALSKQERKALNDYSGADAIITCGGSFLTDAYSLDLTLLGFDTAIKTGKPVILLGQSIGPFKSEEKRLAVAERLRKFSYVAVRDNLSYTNALEMGCDPNKLIEGRDMAFLLEPPLTERPRANGKVTVGISVRKWTFPYANEDQRGMLFKQYVLSFTVLVERLINEVDVNVVFVSTCQGDKSYSYQDNEIAKEILAQLSKKARHRCQLIEEFQTPESFLENLKYIDLFIGTRMHACILSLLSGIPTVNVCYEFKSRELFEAMGLEDYICDIENIDVEHILPMILKMQSDYSELSKKILLNVSKFRDLNKKVISNIFSSI